MTERRLPLSILLVSVVLVTPPGRVRGQEERLPLPPETGLISTEDLPADPKVPPEYKSPSPEEAESKGDSSETKEQESPKRENAESKTTFEKSVRKARSVPPPQSEDSDKSLEQVIAEALRGSPEIQMAEIKLREAEAALVQTRMEITQKVLHAHAVVESSLIVIKQLRRRIEELAQKRTEEAVSQMFDLEMQFQKESRNLREATDTLKMLAGQVTGRTYFESRIYDSSGGVRGIQKMVQRIPGARVDTDEVEEHVIVTAPPTAQNAIAGSFQTRGIDVVDLEERLQGTFNDPVTMQLEIMPVGAFAEFLKDKTKINVLVDPQVPKDTTISVNIREIPILGVLEAIEDVNAIRFVSRRYGLLITTTPPQPGPAYTPIPSVPYTAAAPGTHAPAIPAQPVVAPLEQNPVVIPIKPQKLVPSAPLRRQPKEAPLSEPPK